MPQLPFFLIVFFIGTLLFMFLYILGRRSWRFFTLRRIDQSREHWSRRLPALMAGAIPTAKELRSAIARETLESLLTRRLQSADEKESARIFAIIESSGLLGRTISMLHSGSRWQRLHAAARLGEFRSPAAVPDLVQILDDRWEQLRRTAFRSLALIGSAEAGPEVLRSLSEGIPVEPSIWLDAAARCVTDPREFLPLLEDDRGDVRALAARAIAEFPKAVPLDFLYPYVSHPDPEVRGRIFQALGRTRDDRVIPALVAATADETWFVRLRALAALTECGPTAALEAVLKASGDPHFLVRQKAGVALAKLTTHPAKIIGVLLERKDRYALEGYLAQLGRAGVFWRTLPLLKASDYKLREQAEELLRIAIDANFYRQVLHGVEVYPDWRVRVALARLLRCNLSPMVRQEIEKRLASTSLPRGRRILRAILQKQKSPVVR